MMLKQSGQCNLWLNPLFIAVALWLTTCTLSASEQKNPKHSYQSCTLITAELLTTVQLYEREIPLDLLMKSLPQLSSQGEERVRSIYNLIATEGTLTAYSSINSDYAKCSKQVFSDQGKPAPTTTDYGFYFCAGENKLRYEIALAIFLKADRADVIPQLPASRQQIGKHYYDLAGEKGLEEVFELMANSLKHCINQIPSQNP